MFLNIIIIYVIVEIWPRNKKSSRLNSIPNNTIKNTLCKNILLYKIIPKSYPQIFKQILLKKILKWGLFVYKVKERCEWWVYVPLSELGVLSELEAVLRTKHVLVLRLLLDRTETKIKF